MGARITVVLLAVVLVLAPAGVGAPEVAASGHGDPLRAEQWGLDLIGIDRAWTHGRGRGVTVAIIDTGVALDHPDLVDRFVRRADGRVLGLDLVDGGAPHDTHGHGTLVAGIVAASADNGEGIAGVAPRARLLPIRVLDGKGDGNAADVDRAIRWAVDRGADVINLSVEAAQVQGRSGGPAVPTDAVAYATAHDVVVVVAAGNSAGSAAAYPADTPALLVGAVDQDDRPAAFSEVGRSDAVLAPGVGIVSTWCRRVPDGCDPAASPYAVAEGTSFATPHVSGIAALLVARGLPADQVVRRIRDTAVDIGASGPDEAHGAGRVDAAAALAVGGITRPAARPRRAPQSTPPTPEPPAELPTVEEPPPAPPPAPLPEPEPVEEVEAAPEPVEESVEEPVEDPPVILDDPGDAPATTVTEPVEPPVSGQPVAAPDLDPFARTTDGLRPLDLVAVLVLVLTMAVWSGAARRWDPAV